MNEIWNNKAHPINRFTKLYANDFCTVVKLTKYVAKDKAKINK